MSSQLQGSSFAAMASNDGFTTEIAIATIHICMGFAVRPAGRQDLVGTFAVFEGRCVVPEFVDPERRVLICADMECYSRRDNLLQHRAQSAFTRILNEATTELGLSRVTWQIQQGGDGELAILPAGTSERAVVTGLAPIVDRLLREHNRGLAPEARVRLRIAVHQGLVHLDGANGFPGEAVVHVCRLADAPPLKAALRRFAGADIALIVSDAIFRDVVQHYRDLRPEHFARVSATLPDKNFSAVAWIYVPGENVADKRAVETGETTPVELAHPAAVPPEREPASQVFQGIAAHGPATFGNHNTLNALGWTGQEGGASR
jgi:hypothetical protein